jgi:hypothetical protein
MPVAIKLHVYSGREDPIWKLSDRQAADLLPRRENLFERATAARPVYPGLGYRGFTVFNIPEARVTKQFIVEATLADDNSSSSFISGEADLEEQLLETGTSEISARVRDHVLQSLRDGPSILRESFTDTPCPPCGGGSAPPYDPGYWNNDQTRLRRNNCYNYANNRATNTFAQPGRGSGQALTSLACGNVRAAAERDGLRTVPTIQASIVGWYVALVVWPNEDYHWYRQDDIGCWSHKPGSTEAKNTDHAGRRITDPRTCDRGPYTDFCVYMTTDTSVTIR